MTQTSTDKPEAQESDELEKLKKENESLNAKLGYAEQRSERYEAHYRDECRRFVEYKEADRASVIKFFGTIGIILAGFAGAMYITTKDNASGAEERRNAEREAIAYTKGITGAATARAVCSRQRLCPADLTCRAHTDTAALTLCCDGDRPGNNNGCRPTQTE